MGRAGVVLPPVQVFGGYFPLVGAVKELCLLQGHSHPHEIVPHVPIYPGLNPQDYVPLKAGPAERSDKLLVHFQAVVCGKGHDVSRGRGRRRGRGRGESRSRASISVPAAGLRRRRQGGGERGRRYHRAGGDESEGKGRRKGRDVRRNAHRDGFGVDVTPRRRCCAETAVLRRRPFRQNISLVCNFFLSSRFVMFENSTVCSCQLECLSSRDLGIN